jgi:hypothetical protein
MVHLDGIAPGWFALVDVPIILGRDVTLADTAAAERPVVIGSDLARAMWGESNPIGRRLHSPPVPGLNTDSMSLTVVGVYDASVRMPEPTWQGGAVGGDKLKRIHTAHGKKWRRDHLMVRTRGPAAEFIPQLQKFVREANPALPVSGMITIAQVDERERLETMKMTALASTGGILALLLASLGLYGVVSLAVRQRTREIGIRIAIGAHPMRVARMFLASGVRTSVVAIALGLPLSLVALKVGMAQGLVIAPEVNPIIIGSAITVILMAVASAATWIPARRAAMVDPASTLRTE